jgi:hypothetical protein
MTIKNMDEKCAQHACIAARQAKMKGLDPKTTGAAFIAAGIQLTFDVSFADACFAAANVGRQIGEVLMNRSVERFKNSGASETDVAELERTVANLKSRGAERVT